MFNNFKNICKLLLLLIINNIIHSYKYHLNNLLSTTKQRNNRILLTSYCTFRNDNTYIHNMNKVIPSTEQSRIFKSNKTFKTLSFLMIYINLYTIQNVYSDDKIINNQFNNDLLSDEIEVIIDSDPIGIGLIELKYKNNKRIIINSIKEYANNNIKLLLKKNMILLSINNINIEGKDLDYVLNMIKETIKPFKFIFRDNLLFYQLIKNPIDHISNSNNNNNNRVIYKTCLLNNNQIKDKQILTVEKIKVIKIINSIIFIIYIIYY